MHINAECSSRGTDCQTEILPLLLLLLHPSPSPISMQTRLLCNFLTLFQCWMRFQVAIVIDHLKSALATSKGAVPHSSSHQYLCHATSPSWFGPDRGGQENVQDYRAVVCPCCVSNGTYPPYAYARCLYPHQDGSEASPTVRCLISNVVVGNVLDIFPAQVLVVANQCDAALAGRLQKHIGSALGARCIHLDIEAVEGCEWEAKGQEEGLPGRTSEVKVMHRFERLIQKAVW